MPESGERWLANKEGWGCKAVASTNDRAETLVTRIRLLTDGVYIRDVQIRGAKWSRVVMGPFEDETVAGDWVEKARSVTPDTYFRIAEQPLDTDSRE